MKKTILRILVLISIALNIALLMRVTGFASPKKTKLPLTDRQVERIQEIRGQDDSRRTELQKELQAEQHRLVSLLKEKEIDRPEVNRCLEQINARQMEMQKMAVEQIIKCRQVMDHQECRCFIDECARKMSISPESERSCPFPKNKGGSRNDQTR